MPIGTAAGYPQYSGNFIPEIWSGQLNEKFYTATVFNAITNNKYEGEIRGEGDKVIIRQIADVTVRDLVKGQELEVESPEAPPLELMIDRGHYFNVFLDDIDKYQSDVDLMKTWSQDATEKMRNRQDTLILGTIPADVHPSNAGLNAGVRSGVYSFGAAGNEVVITANDVLDIIVDAGAALDEQDVPFSDRWMVAPAWFIAMIKQSELRDASIAGDGKTLLRRDGRVGRIDRFEMFMSNNCPFVLDNAAAAGAGANCWYVLFGQKHAISYASQINDVETLRSERAFGNLVRGKVVYGFEVLVPEALGMIYCRRGV